VEGISVEDAKPSDDREAARVFQRAFATVRSAYRPRAGARTGRDPRKGAPHRLVARLDGRIVGTLAYYLDPDAIHLMGFGVLLRARRKGIGRAMLEEVARIARARGKSRITLYTIREGGAQGFFEACGFEATGENPARWCESDIHPVLHEVRMERAL
jgi:GNAT superfamily N-acetyltransferase